MTATGRAEDSATAVGKAGDSATATFESSNADGVPDESATGTKGVGMVMDPEDSATGYT